MSLILQLKRIQKWVSLCTFSSGRSAESPSPVKIIIGDSPLVPLLLTTLYTEVSMHPVREQDRWQLPLDRPAADVVVRGHQVL